MGKMLMGVLVVGVLFLVYALGTSFADDKAPSGKQAKSAQMQEVQTALKDASVTVNLLENELNQKRKQVASLGRQLQEERQAHAETRNALAKLQPKDEAK